MRFTCQIEHKDTGEQKAVVVALSAEEVGSIEAMRAARDENADLMSEALALHHAYHEVPNGFRHTEPPLLVATH